MNSIHFSIVILNYKGLEHLQECLSSLAKQEDQDFEILFVDNNSNDGSVEWVSQFLQDHQIQGQSLQSGSNLGFAGGNNFALPHCRGEWIFFLNNDTVMDPDFISNFKSAISAHPKYWVFGPVLMQYTDKDLIDSAGDGLYTAGPAFQYLHCKTSEQLPNHPYESLSACGGAVCYHHKVLDEIGIFDDDFWLLFEDLDLGIRAFNHGYPTLILPGTQVYHKGGESIGKVSPLRYHFEMRNQHWVRVKNFPFLTLLKYFPLVSAQSLLSFGFALIRGQVFLFIKFKLAAWRGYPKMWSKRKLTRPNGTSSRKDFEKQLRKGWFRQRLGINSRYYSKYNHPGPTQKIEDSL